MKIILQSLLFVWLLSMSFAHSDELKSCLEFSKSFKSNPVNLKGASPLQNQAGEWLTESRPFEVAFDPQCKVGDIALISVMCSNGELYELIAKSKVVYNEDPQGFTIAMISAEDFETLKPFRKKFPFYAQCRSPK